MANMPAIQQCGVGNTYLYDCMSIPDPFDRFVDRAAAEGTGVVSGMDCTADGTDLTLTFAAGYVSVKGTLYSYAGGTVAVGTGSASMRRDAVVFRATGPTTGSLVVIPGTPWGVAAGKGGDWDRNNRTDVGPIKPNAVGATDVPLREVVVPAGVTAITTAMVAADKRVLLGLTALQLPPNMSFVSGSTPPNTRRSTLAWGGDGIWGQASDLMDVCQRQGFTLPAAPTRCRLRIRNANNVGSGFAVTPALGPPIAVSGVWWGTPNAGVSGSPETAWQGDFTAAPTQVLSGFTVDPASNGAEYVSPWFTPPPVTPYQPQALSIAWLTSSGATIYQDPFNAQGLVWHSATNVGLNAVGGAQAAPTLGTSSPGYSSLDVRMDYELVGVNQIGLVLGDSMGNGTYPFTGAKFGINGTDNCWPQKLGLKLGHCIINASGAGAQLGNYMNLSTGLLSRFDLATCPPDYAIIQLGYNDINFGALPVKVTNVSVTGTTATVTAAGHGLSNGGLTTLYTIIGASGAGAGTMANIMNGNTYVVSGVSGNNFNVTVSATPSDAYSTGGMTCAFFSNYQQNMLAVIENLNSLGIRRIFIGTIEGGCSYGLANSWASGVLNAALTGGSAVTAYTLTGKFGGDQPGGGLPGPTTNWVTSGGASTAFWLDSPNSGIMDGPFLGAASGATVTGSGVTTVNGNPSFTPLSNHVVGAQVLGLNEGWRRLLNRWIKQGVPGVSGVFDFANEALQPMQEPRTLNWDYYTNNNPGPHPSDPGLYEKWAQLATAGLTGS
jgi:lysophospholipase L1-like esterase